MEDENFLDTEDNLMNLLRETMKNWDERDINVSDIKEECIKHEDTNQDDDTEKPIKRIRGPDKEWDGEETYKDPTEFKASKRRKEIEEFMCKKKSYNTFAGRMEHYICKNAKRRWFKICPVDLKVCYIATSFEIVVFFKNQEHLHEEDPECTTIRNFHFTQAQEEIIKKGINYSFSTKQLLKNLMEAGASTNGKYPTISQLGVKKRKVRNQLKRSLMEKNQELELFQGKGRRSRGGLQGGQVEWHEVASFPCQEEWKRSKEHQEMKQFLQKHAYNSKRGTSTTFYCLQSRKPRGFRRCRRQLKVKYHLNSKKVPPLSSLSSPCHILVISSSSPFMRQCQVEVQVLTFSKKKVLVLF